MKSKWSELKPEAILLRKKGFSIGHVESKLGIPRSTLSGWFKDVKLTSKQKFKLQKNSKMDPNTLRFFLKGIEKVFGYDIAGVRCELYLRADQKPDVAKKFGQKNLTCH